MSNTAHFEKINKHSRVYCCRPVLCSDVSFVGRSVIFGSFHMPHLDQKHVIIVAHSQRRAVMVGLARKFKETGAGVTLVCSTAQELSYYKSNFGSSFDKILVSELAAKLALEPVVDEEKVIRRAIELEQWCGANFQRLILQDRHLGRGYALGARAT